MSVAGLGAAAQPAAPPPRALAVTSTLERILSASEAGEAVVTVEFANTTADVVDSIRITSAVPADSQYVPQSASGPGSDVLFSIDGGRTFGRPEELVLAAPDGGTRSAQPSEYTHVRWVLRAPLDAGATAMVRFRAVPR